jgi:hypothetical protein
VQTGNLNPHLQAQLGIKVRERFIEQEDARMTDNCDEEVEGGDRPGDRADGRPPASDRTA